MKSKIHECQNRYDLKLVKLMTTKITDARIIHWSIIVGGQITVTKGYGLQHNMEKFILFQNPEGHLKLLLSSP